MSDKPCHHDAHLAGPSGLNSAVDVFAILISHLLAERWCDGHALALLQSNGWKRPFLHDKPIRNNVNAMVDLDILTPLSMT